MEWEIQMYIFIYIYIYINKQDYSLAEESRKSVIKSRISCVKSVTESPTKDTELNCILLLFILFIIS